MAVRPPVAGPWEILEIEATRDERLIRRAYARRLKVTHPEDDAQGFQRLRQAYEWALAWASHPLEAKEEDESEVEEPREEAELPDFDPVQHSRVHPAQVVVGQQPSITVEPTTPLSLIEDEASYEAAFEAVERAAFETASNPLRVERALDALLKHPALLSIGVHQQTEQRLLQLALSQATFASLLVEPMAKAFAWNPDRLGGLNRMSASALGRLDEARFLKSLFNRDHARFAAWQALTRPPTRWTTLRYRVSDGLAGDVTELLAKLRGEWPWFEALIDPAALAWWDGYLGQPQVRGLAVFISGFGGLFGLLVAAAFGATPEGALALLAAAAMALSPFAWVHGVRRPRAAWQKLGGGEGAPLWMTLGWAPASLALIALALVMPTGPLSPGLVLLTGLCLAMWAAIVAQPDTRPLGANRNESFAPWYVRAATYHGFLVLYWMRGLYEGGDRWLLTGLAAIAAAACWTAGEDTLLVQWNARTNRPARLALMAAQIAAAVAMITVGFVEADPSRPTALALAGVALLVVLHKVPARRLLPGPVQFRTIAMLGGLLIWPFLATMASRRVLHGWMGIWTLWLLSGVIFAGLALIQGEFVRPTRKRRPGELF